ncbi:uncharacterized protein METZ01_LOCUS429244, partial [marine metagenome]
VIDRGFWPDTTGESDSQDPTPPVDAAHRLIKNGSAHGIVDDIGSIALGKFLHLISEAAQTTVR